MPTSRYRSVFKHRFARRKRTVYSLARAILMQS